MLTAKVKDQIIAAMKAKDAVRTTTLKMLSSSLHNAEIDKHGELTPEEELVVVKKEAKKRKDAIEAYEKAGATERAASEQAELAILQEFLPAQMNEAELGELVTQAVAETGAQSMADMGKVMSIVMAKTAGAADGKLVSELVKKALA